MKVTCGKDIIERAKRDKRFIITIAVNGKPIGDDSMCIQRVADLKMAQKVAKYAIALMKSGAKNCTVAPRAGWRDQNRVNIGKI